MKLKEIVDYIIETKENKSYPRVLKILTDARDAIMSLSINDLAVIVAENYKSLEQYEFINDAIILKNPKETGISMLYQELSKTKKYRFKIFSNEEAARHWLSQL
ncbi:MAG: hypothetical protein ABFS32_01695 [Bacteroidota bacterium]